MDEYVDNAGFTHFPKRKLPKKELTLENLINYPEYFWGRMINSKITVKIVAIICACLFLLGGLIGFGSTKSVYTKKIEAQEQAYAEAERLASQQAEKEATEGQRITMARALTENLARVLQGVDRYDLSKAQKLGYLQIVKNRSNPEIQYDVMRGTDTMEQVLSVPQQFEGFTYNEGYYTKENYAIAEEFLNGEQNYLNSDRYFWAKISNGTFVAMDSFDGSGSNQKVS